MMLVVASPILLAACSDANGAAEDRLKETVETSVGIPATFSLSEAQLLNADVVGPDGKEVGDVAKVLRNTDGKVDRLLVEAEGSNSERYVELPR